MRTVRRPSQPEEGDLAESATDRLGVFGNFKWAKATYWKGESAWNGHGKRHFRLNDSS